MPGYRLARGCVLLRHRLVADVAVTGFGSKYGRDRLNQVQIAIVLLLYIFATALPALIYAIKLHRKVNELIVLGPFIGLRPVDGGH